MHAAPLSPTTSPFLTDRARARVPQVLEWAAIAGAAVLLSPEGIVVATAGRDTDLAEARIARVLRERRGSVAGEVRSFSLRPDACVHALALGMGWTLCVVSTLGVRPRVVLERLRRAGRVLALAFVEGALPTPGERGRGSGGGGAPAEVFAHAVRRRN
jgi:hypothetical protein